MQPVAEKWDGSRWTVTEAPSPGKHGDDLTAVSCAGPAFCLLIGTPPALGPLFGGPFADHWSGNRWHMQPLASVPGQALPDGVSCPLPTRCMVVGENLVSGRARPLIEEWTGSGWAQLPAAGRGPLISVSHKVSAMRGFTIRNACPAEIDALSK
jgi:hypothetical protein